MKINKYTKRVQKPVKISKEEYDLITDQAIIANEILHGDRHEFLREYFQSAIDYIEKSVLENTVREVDEVVTISERITKIFKTPKKVQIDEMSGQYKFIKKFFDDMRDFSNVKADLDSKIESNQVIIKNE